MDPLSPEFTVQLFRDNLLHAHNALADFKPAEVDGRTHRTLSDTAADTRKVVVQAQALPAAAVDLKVVKEAQSLCLEFLKLTSYLDEPIVGARLSDDGQNKLERFRQLRVRLEETLKHSTFIASSPELHKYVGGAAAKGETTVEELSTALDGLNEEFKRDLHRGSYPSRGQLQKALESVKTRVENLSEIDTTPEGAIGGVDQLVLVAQKMTTTFDLAQKIADTFEARSLDLTNLD